MFDEYQLKIIAMALQYLSNDCDEHDLDELMYSEPELAAEINSIMEKIEVCA
jgi:hypothetical protein